MFIYKADSEGRVIGIWKDSTKGDNDGVEILGPIQDSYVSSNQQGIPLWKEVSEGVIEQRTQAEVDADYVEPPKSGTHYFNVIMAGLTEQEQIDFMDVYDEFSSFGLLIKNGMVEEAKLRIDAAETAGMLTSSETQKIKDLIDGA